MASRPARRRCPRRRGGGAPPRASPPSCPLRGLPAARFSPPALAVELDELAQDAADDAAVSVLRRLDDFRGESSFRTWAYKFALLEASVKVRRRAWRDREVTLEPEHWESLAHAGPGPDDDAENAALLEAVRDGIRTALTPRSGRSSSRPCSKACPSTCWRSASTRTVTRSTSCFTTLGGACGPTSPRRDSRR